MAIQAYIVALLMGLAGSLHCAGMCGAIMLILPFQRFEGVKKIVAVGLYHSARITAYGCMAVVLFSFRGAFNPVVQQYVSVILGCLLLLAGLLSFMPLTRGRFRLPWSGFVQKQLSLFVSKPTLTSITVSGFLNGLLPCGLVYMVLSATLALQSAGQAALFTAFFGLGTIPVLVGITLLRHRLPFLQGRHIKKITPVVVFSMGALLLVRGMNLGIPYLSPKVSIANEKIVHSCCEKK